MKKIIFLSSISLLISLCGCAHSESPTLYSFNGFKIFSWGFLWGDFSVMPVTGEVEDSFIFYKKDTKRSKVIRLIKTGNNYEEELLKQTWYGNNNIK